MNGMIKSKFLPSGVRDAQEFKDLSPSELKQFLLPRMEKENLPVKYLDILEKERISGKIFLTLEEKDISTILSESDAVFGVRRFLFMQVRELSQQPLVLDSKETLRRFDSPVTHVTVYQKGRCCDVSNFIKDKTTRPIKIFRSVQENPKHKIPEFIASEVIPFVSACLNERRNGIIYFGIHCKATNLHRCGEIVGICLDQNETFLSLEEGVKSGEGKFMLTQQVIQCELNLYLEQSFLPCYQEIIKNTVRDAKLIPVVINNEPRTNLWVVEIDVNASSELLKDEIIPTFLKLLPIHRKKIKDGIFTFSSDGKPKLLDSDARHNFERNHACILAQRKQDEQNEQEQFHPNLRTKLLNLLTGGNEVIRDMMFFFLVLSPVTEISVKECTDSKKNLSAENLQFVKYLGPEIVFDFDSYGSEKGIYSVLKASETMRVLTTDNFDKSKRSLEEMKEQGDSLANENKISWFFCNGYAPTEILPLSAVEWSKKRKSCFQDCLRLFITTFGKERVTVLFCLMSKDCDIMTDASGEILANLSDNWMVIAESEEVAQNWQKQVLLRNWVDKQDLYDRCVIGMPWDHVNITIQQAKQPTPSDICYLPSSTGALIEVKEKKIKDWCHIEVLSANFKPFDYVKRYPRKVEERFYRGEQAQWSNFYFKTQVLVRDKHEVLMSHVYEALKSPGKEKRNKVAIVELVHQPMAGGTTSAKQVLWELRQHYRCCVIKTIKERTAQDLNELHKYDETNPKPLLILIDNEDEDKLAQLLDELENQGQKNRRFDMNDTCEVYCVAIICRRRTSIVRPLFTKGVLLEHELSQNELQWFTEKDKYLNQRFKKDVVSFTDPKFLIAFNIIKQRFDPKYINKTLSAFTDGVVQKREVKLLKMVCFLNLYDPSFTKISVSCLDDLLLDKKESWGTKKRTLVRNEKWEACQSPAVKVLLNLSSESMRSEKNRSTVSTFNKVIAEGVLKRIMERTSQKVSEIMLELLDSSMFVEQKHDTANLISIVNNIVKTRVVVGGNKQKFSQFLLDVKKKEGSEIAVNVLEQVFEMNNDPYTAQLIARFYMIEMKNWDKAEIYARRATSKRPTSTYLWNTSAQVYQCQLQDELLDTSKLVTQRVIQHWISLSIKSLIMFTKEEEVNDANCEEHEPSSSCYFGELKAIDLILQGISKNVPFSSPLSLHRFLIEPDFVPTELAFLTDEERRHFKSLKAISEEAFTRLNDENLQMKKTFDFTFDAKDYDYDFESIGKLFLSLENYFGHNEVALKTPEKEFYNFTLAKKLGGTHLRQLLDLRESFTKLQKIYELMRDNVNSESIHKFEYLLTAVGSCTVLLLSRRCPSDLDFNTLLSWCQSLIELEKKRPRGKCYLEPYLYYIMYNFPTEERSKYKICSPGELANVIKAGTEAFMKNNPSYAGRRFRKRRVTTLFFLGAKGRIQDIVHHDMLREGMDGQSIEDKWLLPELQTTLRQLEGTLLEGGDKVRFSRFEIHTSHPIEDTAIWQKRVNFYVGFSWAGPLAYGIKPLD